MTQGFNKPAVRQLDHFINDFFQLPSVWNNPSADVQSLPAANVTETPDAFQLELSVPGRSKDDIQITLDKNLLTISYEKKDETVEENVRTVRREFRATSFKRSFSLDDKVETGAIHASYENGILRVTLPKKEELKQEPKQITIS